MPSINTKVWLALKSGIDSLPLAWPVAWPGSTYRPVASTQFLAVGRATQMARRFLINRPVNDRAGMLTITPVMKIGQDIAVYEEYAGIVADHFRGCLTFQDVTLTLMGRSGETATAVEGYRDGAWWRVPVNVPWRTWA